MRITGSLSTSRSPTRKIRTAALTALLWLVGLAYGAPLLWMVLVSLKPPDQAASPGVGLLPRFTQQSTDRPPATGSTEPVAGQNARLPDLPRTDLRLWQPAYWSALGAQAAENYRGTWQSPIADFPVYLRNSTLIAVLTVIGAVVSSAIVAYGFSRVRWRGRDVVFVIVLATMMIPPAVLMAPQYVLFKNLGWIGTFLPLWAPAWFGSAFGIYLLRQFFLSIPREIDEAARIDGCGHAGIFARHIVPLSRPPLAVVALLTFAGSWNDFQGPLLYLNHQEQYTLSLGLQAFHMQHGGTPWNQVMAASVIVILPVMVLYTAARRLFVQGVAGEGVKG